MCERCDECLFSYQEYGIAGCGKNTEPEWNDDLETWECEFFTDITDVLEKSESRFYDRMEQAGKDAAKGINEYVI